MKLSLYFMKILDILAWLRHVVGFDNDSTGPVCEKIFTSGEFLRSMLSKKSPHQKHIQLGNQITCSGLVPDIIGLVPESSGNKYLLLIVDHFTKWYEEIPESNQKASTVAMACVNVCVSRFGCPANLHSDKGSNFLWNLFKNMCK